MRTASLLFWCIVSALVCAAPGAQAAYPEKPIEMIVAGNAGGGLDLFWDQTLAKMVKTDAWKKYLDQYQWFDAYADSATFAKDLRHENDVYVKILSDLGMAKGPKK